MKIQPKWWDGLPDEVKQTLLQVAASQTKVGDKR